MKVTTLLQLCNLANDCGLLFWVGIKGKDRGKLFVEYPSPAMEEAWRPVIAQHGPKLAKVSQPVYDARAIQSGEIELSGLDRRSRKAALRVIRLGPEQFNRYHRQSLLGGGGYEVRDH